MKTALLAALLLLAACSAPQSPPRATSSSRSAGAPPAGETRAAPGTTDNTATNPNTVRQDAADCERQAAISGSAGSRAQLFNECMKARRSAVR
jgi:hypothetical protein